MTQTGKSFDELRRICAKAKALQESREPEKQIEILVGMGTVGIAAGARDTLRSIFAFIEEKHLEGIIVRQTGNLGIDSYEPVVVVTLPEQEKVVYGRVTPEIARIIMDQHIRRGLVAADYVVRG